MLNVIQQIYLCTKAVSFALDGIASGVGVITDRGDPAGTHILHVVDVQRCTSDRSMETREIA